MKAAIYLRVSSSDQSTAAQEREVLAFVKRAGYKQYKIYRDATGGAKASRPALDQLIQDARAGAVVRVVAYKLDRLGRSLGHFVQLASELARLKIPIICTSQGIDTSEDSPTGRLQLQILMAVAEFERELIRERVNSGLDQARAKGVQLGRPRKNEEHRADAKKLRKDGKSIRAIAECLKISKSAVERLLQDS